MSKPPPVTPPDPAPVERVGDWWKCAICRLDGIRVGSVDDDTAIRLLTAHARDQHGYGR